MSALEPRLTPADVAELLSCSTRQACLVMRRAGGYAFQGSWRLRREKLDEYLSATPREKWFHVPTTREILGPPKEEVAAACELLSLDMAWDLVRKGGFGSFVYFITSDGKRVKIGTAKNVASRLRELQCANPDELYVALQVPGGPDLEWRLHEAFARERIRGEWFRVSERLRGFMIELADFHNIGAGEVQI